MSEPDFGKMNGWKAGETRRVYYPGFFCTWEVLSGPLLDRLGDVYVQAREHATLRVQRLYEMEITSKQEVVAP